ncbi:MAG: sulfite exporter TauE/SafE family protein [Rhodospirillaceae bacterium]|nr:sulfite exporter TauE/SafE family protein [Rhodospirillaceae bacterium]MBT7267230.1 sulfite exporter TauE/SafE family protein [Rhodospirillaceae bacterium]
MLQEFIDLIFTQENLFILAIVFAGGVVRGYTGFGSGLIMVPLFSLLWSPVDAVATTVGLGLFAGVQMAFVNLKITNWREVAPMIAALIFITPLGTMLLVSLDADIVKKITAAVILFVTAISLRGWQYRGPRGHGPSFVAGAIGAFINGLAAVGGPAVVLYLITMPDSAKVQRANIATIASLMGVAVCISTFSSGHVGSGVLLNILIFAIPYMIFVWMGIWLFAILPGTAFRLIVLWILVCISIAILLA